MGTNLPFCSLQKALLIAVGPTLPYLRLLPEGEGIGRFKERKKEEKKKEKGRENMPFLFSISSAKQKTRGKERRGSVKENKK